MKPAQKVAGRVEILIDGDPVFVKGNVSYNLGKPKKEEVLGLDALHGYKETPQAAFIAVDVTFDHDLDLEAILTASDVTVLARLANGVDIILRNAFQTGEGEGNPEEGTVSLRFVGHSAELLKE